MSSGMKIVRGLAAMIAGYGLIAGLTTLGFNVWLGGADLYRGGPILMVKGILVAVASGLCGGYLAGVIGGSRPIPHALLVLILLAIDTAYVLFWFNGTAPIWFDAIGSATLMGFTVVGGGIRAFQIRDRTED